MKTKREDFDSSRLVRLGVLTRKEDGSYLYPGEYKLDEIPDSAIACGIVTQQVGSRKSEVESEELKPKTVAPTTKTEAEAVTPDPEPAS